MKECHFQSSADFAEHYGKMWKRISNCLMLSGFSENLHNSTLIVVQWTVIAYSTVSRALRNRRHRKADRYKRTETRFNDHGFKVVEYQSGSL